MAPLCFFSVIAAHFLTLSGLENLRFFHPPKRDQKWNKTPTNNWADFIRFRDELQSERFVPPRGYDQVCSGPV
jgi:hypothetical protein